MDPTDSYNQSNEVHQTQPENGNGESIRMDDIPTTKTRPSIETEVDCAPGPEPHLEWRRDTSDGESVARAASTCSRSFKAGTSLQQNLSRSKDTTYKSSPSITLKRSLYIVLLVLLYSGAAIYAWVIICILKDRPIGGTGYGTEAYDKVQNHHPTDAMMKSYPNAHTYLAALFAKSERYLRAARIIQSLVSVLTIPLTSAVCSQAAVAYIQRQRGVRRPTLRQTMALADKGWTDIGLLIKLFFGGWNKYKSSLLLFALFLNILGAAISPVQQIFLSYKTIKRVIYPIDLPSITDYKDLFPPYYDSESTGDEGLISTKLRTILAAASNTEVQPRLWSMDNATDSMNEAETGLSTPFQTKAQNTLANITSIDRPFWAQVPSGTNTGLQQRQYAPRINSTVTWANDSASDLPADCNFSSDAYYIRWEYDDIFQYVFEICMPGNASQSPWQNIRGRQDLHEELYVKMNFSGDYNVNFPPGGTPIKTGIYSKKLTIDTTAAYFELPNYTNGQVPGPLISNNPWDSNDTFVGNYKRSSSNSSSQDAYLFDSVLNTTYAVNNVYNKGPLLNIAMALFGQDSLADIQHTTLAAYAKSDTINNDCISIAPLIPLLMTPNAVNEPLKYFKNCLSGYGLLTILENEASINNNLTLHATVAWYFWLFTGQDTAPSTDRVQNAFASAAFLAIDTMMMSPYSGSSGSIDLSYDMGSDLQIPSVSRTGVIFISVLLGLDLLCLLALAFYSSWIPRWTDQLDSFAMLRIGASISEKVPLLATHHTERIKALDSTPGWMGNSSQNDDIGELCLGGERPLAKTKSYLAYDTDERLTRRGPYSLAQTECQ